MNKKDRQEKMTSITEGYQPTLTGLKDKNGQPLVRGALDPKKLKPPKNWETAVQPPKVESDKKGS
jgi:hypothetical protein